MFGFPGGLIAASPLALVACGGGGGSDSSDGDGGSGSSSTDADVAALAAKLPALTYTATAARVVLPAGAGVAVEATRLVTPRNVSEVKPDGTGGVVSVESAPQMAYVFDAAGRLLLMSMVEAGVRTQVDSRGTAEALLLLSSEAALQNAAVGIAMRHALATTRYDAVVEPVRLAIEAAATRNGIDPADSALVEALRASTLVLRRTASTPPVPAGKGVRREALSVDPIEVRSGLSVDQTADFNTVTVTNRYRRRTHATIQTVGTYDATGVYTPTVPPTPVADFALAATTALSFDNIVISLSDLIAQFESDLGFIGEYEAGNGVFAPVTSAPVTLPAVAADVQAAKHTVRVIGIGGSHAGTLTDAEGKIYDELLWTTLIDDIAKPFIRTLLIPFLSERAPATLGPQFNQGTWQLVLTGFTDISSLAVGGTFFPNTVASLEAGDFKGAVSAFLTEFFTSNTFQALYERGFKAWIARAGEFQINDVRDSAGGLVGVNLISNPELISRSVKSLEAALGKLARILQLIKVGALIGDYAALAHDLLVSDVLTEFAVTASKAQVKLSPSPLVAYAVRGSAGKATVTASITGIDGTVPAEAIFLKWECTGRYGHLYQQGGEGLDSFESSLTKPSHDYIPTGVETNPAVDEVIKVTAFYRNPTTAARFEMGTATAIVDVRGEFNIVLSPSTSDVATDHDGYLSAVLEEELPSGATIEWTWSHGGVGTIGDVPPDANLRDSSVVFHSGSAEGAATVTVSATLNLPPRGSSPARTVFARAKTAKLQVKKGLRTVTVSGSWTTDTFTYSNGNGGTGYSVIAFAIVPKVSGYTSCSVVLASSDPYIPKQRSFGPNVFVGRDTDHGEQDRGGAVWLGLSGAAGTIGPDGSGPGDAQGYYGRRFADLVVTATYTLTA